MSSANLALLRGGQVHWRIAVQVANAGNSFWVNDEIVSITGISKTVTFDGSLQGCQPIVVLQRTPEIDEITVGSSFFFYLGTVGIWEGYVSEIVQSETETTFTCNAALSRFNKDFTFYYPRGSSVRWLIDWIFRSNGLMPGLRTEVTAFTDSYYRGCGRISTKFCTLGGLTGVASYGTVKYLGWWSAPGIGWADITDSEGNVIGKRPPEDSTTLLGKSYNLSKTGTSHPEFWDLSWAVADAEGQRGCVCSNPLCFHNVNTRFMLRNVWKYNDLAQQPMTKWPVGEMRNRSTMLYVLSSSTYYPLMPRVEAEGDKKKERFRKITYNKWGGIDKEEDIDLDNINVVPLSAGLWSEQAQSTLGVSWSIPSGTLRKDSYAMTGQGLFQKGTVGDPTGNYTLRPYYSFIGDITFNSGDMSADLANSSFLGESLYAIETQQDIQPVTIMAEEFSYEKHGKEILELGSVGMYEAYGNNELDTKWVDTCPESGTVFEIPLTDDFIMDWQFETYNWLPRAVKLNVRDMMGKDYSIQTDFESSAGNTTDVKEYNLIQSQLWHKAFARNVRGVQGNGETSYGLSSTDWEQNPGFIYDRWTGCSSPTSTTLSATFLNNDAFQYGEYLVCQDGTQKKVRANLGVWSFNSSTNYQQVERDGSTRRWFYDGQSSPAEVIIDGAHSGYDADHLNYLPAQDAPYVDIFTLKSLQLAVHRAFADYRRPTYRVTASLAFASVNPGDIILLKTHAFNDNEKWLALVMSISLNSNDNNVSLLIAPLRTVASISLHRENWPGLSDVEWIDDTLSNTLAEPVRNEPFIMYSQPSIPSEWSHSIVLSSANQNIYWGGSAWWWALKIRTTDENAKLPGNPLTPMKITARNHVTGYQSEFMLTKDDWDWNYNNGVLEPQARMGKIDRLSKAICGENYQGNGFCFYQYIGWQNEFELVFNTQDLPDMSGWEITFEWNDPQPINYFETMFEPDRTKWSSNKTYQSGGNTYNLSNLADIYANKELLVWKFDRDEWNAHDLCFFDLEQYSTSTAKRLYFNAPWDGVYSEMYILMYISSNAANVRFTIASSFRENYSASSQMAQAYFSSPAGTDSFYENLIEGATVKLCKVIKGF